MPQADASPTAGTAPKVSPALIEELQNSLGVLTHHFPGTTTTVAVAVMPDGFVVATGTSACISATNFDPAVGVEIARRNALNAATQKLWELEGYLLRSTLR